MSNLYLISNLNLQAKRKEVIMQEGRKGGREEGRKGGREEGRKGGLQKLSN